MTNDQTKPDVRCAVCLTGFVRAELKAVRAKNCPHCGAMVPFLKMSEDGLIKINWQDIRVLAIYAQRWAKTFKKDLQGNIDHIKALDNIVKHLEQYKPKGGHPLDPEIMTQKIKEADKPLVGAILSPYMQGR